MSYLYLDFETYCDLDLKAVGAYRYVKDCEPLLVSWAVDNEPAVTRDLTREGGRLPPLSESVTLVAHNAAF